MRTHFTKMATLHSQGFFTWGKKDLQMFVTWSMLLETKMLIPFTFYLYEAITVPETLVWN